MLLSVIPGMHYIENTTLKIQMVVVYSIFFLSYSVMSVQFESLEHTPFNSLCFAVGSWLRDGVKLCKYGGDADAAINSFSP